jgi:glycolate oxidase FAD binding subunit
MSTTSDAALAERLAGVVGTEHVSAAPDLDVDGARPAVAVAPGTLEEAAAVLAAVRAAGAALALWGGGTKQRIGPPPARLDVVLHTHRLNALIEWEPADLTAAVQAGMTLAALQSMLVERGQQLPVEAPVPERATLGGLAATNTCGPRRWLYGGWRDLLVGMSMALTDGTVIKTGGRVVKNVQGYDMAKLFTGSLGTLGIIGQANLRLLPLPAARRLLVARGDRETVSGFLETVAASQMRVSTVDLLDGASAGACGLGDGGHAGLVLVEGTRTAVDAHSAQLEREARGAGARPEVVDGDALHPVWRAWVDLGRVDDLGPDEALLTVTARPSDVAEVLRALEGAVGMCGVTARCWARAGNGVAYARLSGEGAALQSLLLARWPATTLVAGNPAVERAARPWGAEPDGLSLMRALKQRFDPAGILQPGRFVGGI